MWDDKASAEKASEVAEQLGSETSRHCVVLLFGDPPKNGEKPDNELCIGWSIGSPFWMLAKASFFAAEHFREGHHRD